MLLLGILIGVIATKSVGWAIALALLTWFFGPTVLGWIHIQALARAGDRVFNR